MFGKEIHECNPIFMGHVDMGGEGISMRPIGDPSGGIVKPVRTPSAILGSLGVCIYVPASRHWLISYSPVHLI